jgi:hypothetical protein
VDEDSGKKIKLIARRVGGFIDYVQNYNLESGKNITTDTFLKVFQHFDI